MVLLVALFDLSALYLGIELTNLVRNRLFLIFLKFLMIMVQDWSLGFSHQLLLIFNLSFGRVSLFVCQP